MIAIQSNEKPSMSMTSFQANLTQQVGQLQEESKLALSKSQTMIEELHKEIQDQQSKLNCLQDKNVNLQKKVEEWEAKHGELSTTKAALDKRLEVKEEELVRCQAGFDSERTQLQETVKTIKNHDNEKAAVIEKLQTKLEENKANHEAVIKQLEQAKMSSLKDVESAKSELAALKKEKEALVSIGRIHVMPVDLLNKTLSFFLGV